MAPLSQEKASAIYKNGEREVSVGESVLGFERETVCTLQRTSESMCLALFIPNPKDYALFF